MLDPLRAIYSDLQAIATVYLERPDPATTTRPYGLLALIGEPRSPLPGETECSFTLTYWGSITEVEAFGDAVDWIHGHKIPFYREAHGLRYMRESRVIVPDADLRGVWMLSDTLTCRYLHVGRMEAAMS